MFKIFYDDYTTYDDNPFIAPAFGVICILDTHGQKHIDCRYDYYVWKFKEDGWTGVDLFGLWDYLAQPGERKVIFGRTVNNNLFEEIYQSCYRELTNG